MIYNFTQHKTTIDQLEDGICDVDNHAFVQELLTFDDIPSVEELQERSVKLAEYAKSLNAEKVMIGGAFYLITRLAKEMSKRGIKVCYSFSKRHRVDEIQPDGSVVKKVLFKHVAVVDELVFSE